MLFCVIGTDIVIIMKLYKMNILGTKKKKLTGPVQKSGIFEYNIFFSYHFFQWDSPRFKKMTENSKIKKQKRALVRKKIPVEKGGKGFVELPSQVQEGAGLFFNQP